MERFGVGGVEKGAGWRDRGKLRLSSRHFTAHISTYKRFGNDRQINEPSPVYQFGVVGEGEQCTVLSKEIIPKQDVIRRTLRAGRTLFSLLELFFVGSVTCILIAIGVDHEGEGTGGGLVPSLFCKRGTSPK